MRVSCAFVSWLIIPFDAIVKPIPNRPSIAIVSWLRRRARTMPRRSPGAGLEVRNGIKRYASLPGAGNDCRRERILADILQTRGQSENRCFVETGQ